MPPQLGRRCAELHLQHILRGLEFHEFLAVQLTTTLLDAIGRGVEVHAIDDSLMDQAIERLRGYRTAP